MAKQRKLKVYRTPIGFHDAYVAAPSQKAALEAWGSDANLFSRGLAEIVDDPELTREPLDNPGKVVKRTRGSLDEHIAALPKNVAPKPANPPSKSKSGTAKAHRKKTSLPRPSRVKLDAAEAALERLAEEQSVEVEALREEEAALEKKRSAMRKRHAAQQSRAQRALAAASADYDQALTKWRTEP